jgi:hypothetical protein
LCGALLRKPAPSGLVAAALRDCVVVLRAGSERSKSRSFGARPLLLEALAIYGVHCSGGWTAMVHRGEVAAVIARSSFMFDLPLGQRDVVLAHRGALLEAGPRQHTTRTVESRPSVVDSCPVDHRTIKVDRVNANHIYVGHGMALVEGSAGPISACKTRAEVSRNRN